MRDVTISRRFGVGAIDTGQLIAEHYRLVERIGSGGTGVVWRATDERLRRSVAIKQIHIKASLPEAERDIVRQRATREARNAARFQHPNAIVVFDITEHEGDPCLVMEYLKSRSLAAVLSAQGTLPLTQVARIGEQVASALIAAHQAGIVHRDVKPGNVLLDDHGTVKITDFGISRATGDVTLTETGLICGTAAYLAPEVARGADPTPAADVFSLGATLFHALEGEPPYGASANPLAVLYAAANGQVSQPRNAGPATDFLLALLNPDPEERPSMRVARDTLAAFADSGANPVPVGFVPASETFARQSASEAATRALRTPVPQPTHQPTERHVRPLPPPQHAAAHPNTAAHPRTAAQPRPASGSSAGKRRAVLIGGVVGAVVAVAALLIGSLNQSDSNSPAAQATPPSASATASGKATTTAPALGRTPSAGTVEWGPAGQLIVDFYSNPSGSWSLLTPAAQKAYGGEQAFRDYWGSRIVDTFSSIQAATGSNNADGSVDMRLGNLTVEGESKQLVLRVVDSGGRLLIDSETR
ncbi:Serine/threonine protein kinase [Nocardia amikacinitolerans]|uniref:non-specific serine/threonine protein kinase n=1 Tax=Nocardia amikacinitolerans TaxID=756689 RepID=A0A285LXQ4_9NOCA|nr:Serine/threonine protein kinase [Nocardia amikacinitolerans]MCP2292487.1 Serine/threonine protein kinase [Nocardia amikacinitolerans]MCP2299252.1 Serine/threonine protein kinase [Nocardia amikacinitolerans]SNY89714.1 Serine/threonine protein kinase [Nocardia amikacinitolerans]